MFIYVNKFAAYLQVQMYCLALVLGSFYASFEKPIFMYMYNIEEKSDSLQRFLIFIKLSVMKTES